MPVLRNEQDQTVTVDEADVGFYTARGWTLDTGDSNYAALQREAAKPVDNGILGQVDAGLTSLASGATLGLSDVALSSLGTTNERKTMLANREANPWTSGIGQFVGSLAPAIANPGSLLSRTPAGLLGGAANEAAAAGRAIGGLRGAATTIGAGAAEGAISNAGSYLGEVALADKDVTAEGLSGALGNGFAFGGAGAGVALGIEKGTIAARRLFARPAEAADDAAAAATAASDWERTSAETLTANEEAAAAARRQLDEARAAREAADVARKTSTVEIEKSKAALQRSIPDESVGIPSYEMFADNPVYRTRVHPTEELSAKGWLEPEGPMQSPAELENARARLARGEKPLIKAGITPSGEIVVFSGAGDLRASVESGKPVRVRWTDAFEPDGKANYVRRGGGADAEQLAYDTMKARIAAGEIEGNIGPFTEAGLEEATKRQLRIEAGRAARLEEVVTEYDAAKKALDDMKSRIAAQEIEGEIGPFTPAGLERAAQRELGRREAARAAAPDVPAVATDVAEAAPAGRSRVKVAAQPSGKTLEELLAETQTRLDGGESLADINKGAMAPAARKTQLADEIDEAAKVFTRYEQAAAAVTEEIGPAAPAAAQKAAKGTREAESTADRKMSEAMTQALDDGAEMGPVAPTPAQRLERAKAARAEADVAYAQARVSEAQASSADRQARNALADVKSKIDAAKPAEPVEMGNPLDDLPSLSFIPVVGPMLSAFVKFRVAKAALTGGRVGATPKTKLAAFVAKTRNAIHSAVDRSLGVVQKGAELAPKAIRPVSSTGALGKLLNERAFDDGEPSIEDDAPLVAKAAVRMREVAYAATNPQAVAMRVRRELRGVHDPDIINATIKHQQAKYVWLNDKAPKRPPENPFAKREWTPPVALAMQWSRRLEVANDPLAAFEALEQRCLTPEAAETLRAIYPNLFAQAQSRMMARAADIKNPLPYRQLQQNSLLFDVPLHPSMEPQNMMILSQAHAAPPDAGASLNLAPPAPASPPVPSIAGGVDLTSLYQTGLDRRAMR